VEDQAGSHSAYGDDMASMNLNFPFNGPALSAYAAAAEGSAARRGIRLAP